MVYFTKHWPAELLSDVEACVEDVVRPDLVRATVDTDLDTVQGAVRGAAWSNTINGFGSGR
jgi:hypothetical protein